MAALMIYLVGARAAGKTAVFDALMRTPQGLNFMTKGGHRLGTVKVPDTRLEKLRGMFNPKKFTPAEVTFVDVALPGNAEPGKGFSQLNAFLGDADAFAVVIQAFGDRDAENRPLDSASQLDSVLLELAMADLEKIERRVEKIEQELKRGLKQNQPELTILQKCKAHIEGGGHLRDLEISAEDEKRISSFCFLSQKRALVIANTAEDDMAGARLEPLRRQCRQTGLDMLVFCAPLEAEIAALAAEEQSAFLQDYGLTEPARARLIQAAYHTLDLISFFTVGEDEVRAWTIRRGTPAQQAAGKIHTDIERGFIRAETVPAGTLLEAGGLSACRDKGVLRLEGKTYEVKDADVIEFRFNA